MKTALTLLLVLLCVIPAAAQLKVMHIEKLALDESHEWAAPRFSPNGSTIFLSTVGYTGIWQHDPAARTTRQISGDRGAGYGFSISDDGNRVAYRRLASLDKSRRRMQEIVVKNLSDGAAVVQSSGRNLSLPSFAASTLVYSVGKETKNLSRVSAAAAPVVLGIENTKIALLRNGRKLLLDPLGKGSYIWPSLSPDGTRLLAYDMTRGAFICNLEGTVITRLGKRNAPTWTRDGKWIVYQDDRDNGQELLSSDLYAVSADGKSVVRLTDTPDTKEIDPQCSPVDNRIICSTADGAILVIDYVEEVQ